MSIITLEAEARSDVGRGASRRLRRLENKIPAIIYGGEKQPENVHLAQNKIHKALENEAIFSSVIVVKVGKEKEQVILKDLQRHPYKPIILHMDFQRVSDKDVLVRHVPLHFINEEEAPGIKEGGLIAHTMTQVEIRCQAKYLPEYIEIDMSNVALNDVIHLAQLNLPKNTELTVDVTDCNHNLPVVSIHLPKIVVEEEPVEEVSETDVEATEQHAEESTDAPGSSHDHDSSHEHGSSHDHGSSHKQGSSHDQGSEHASKSSEEVPPEEGA
ncbi:MAG: 50S ribosomal protein L25/general stress protein Ctc [Legionellales bacterium RIFCSPHIGHO2_12_FULL_42_9]|nr:MAG: 50S ribosomal protein L25/general stress protein Ctc [Legionellales bacterium RIFCSPHIGHO2_12_FULL_42_9]